MKKGSLWYYGRDAEQIWVSLEGHYLRKTPSNCIDNCAIRVVPFVEENEVNSGNVQINISDNERISYDKDKLWSIHKMKVDGNILKYTNNGGFLYLD